MALLGGGGAGNTAGSNPAGVGSSLNYLRTEGGTFAYAYSGKFDVSGTATITALDFTTGSETIVAEFTTTSDIIGGAEVICDILMDDQTVFALKFDVSGGSTPLGSIFPIAIIIPPYTRFKSQQSTNTGDHAFTHMLTGRVYA